MIQFLLNVSRRFAAGCALSETERWRLDPLSHPALRGMSERELGDLPIGHPLVPARLTQSGC